MMLILVIRYNTIMHLIATHYRLTCAWKHDCIGLCSV